MNVSVRPHTRSKPFSKAKDHTTSLLLGYVRTERCRLQEAALNRMALQLNHVVEQDRLDGWPEEQKQRIQESM